MTNLIPPAAKKSIKIEYWIRVLSVWFLAWAGALLVGVFVLVPAYVLITSQAKVYSQSTDLISQEKDGFAAVSTGLAQANAQAGFIIGGFSLPRFTEYLTLFKGLENDEVQLTEIGISRNEKGIQPVLISGEASSRQALAAFRDRLLAQSQVTAVDLPISNLAKDKDITFSLTVTVDSTIAP